MDPIDEILQRVESLPSAPKLLPQLLAALSDMDADIEKVVQLITYDPALTAKVLQVCNSAYYAGQVSTISEAVNRLGFHGVYTIVAVAGGEMLMKKGSQSVIDADAMWRHLVTSAFAAQTLARRIGADESMLFTAGLLHDIGKLPLSEVLQGEYDQLVTDRSLLGRLLAALETASFGMNHAEVGARLLETWSFPPEFVAAIRWHHDCQGAGEAAKLAACIELADVIAHSLDVDDDDPEPFAGIETAPALAVAGMSVGELKAQRERVIGKFEVIDAMCVASL